MEINKIYNESNLETIAKMPDNFIDLVVLSALFVFEHELNELNE